MLLAREMVMACAAGALTPAALAAVVYDGRGGWTGSNAFMTAEWADDLHLTSAGRLTAFSFEYIQSTSSSVTVRFYSNNATNTLYPEAATLLATYPSIPVSGGGASGSVNFNVTIAQQVDLPEDVWMSVQFNAQALLRLQSAPAPVGQSDPTRTTVPGFGNYNFSFPGNFPFVVEVDPIPAPASLTVAALALTATLRRRRC